MKQTLAFIRSWDVRETRLLALLAIVSGIADAVLLSMAATAVGQVVAGERLTWLQAVLYLALFAASNLGLSRALALTCHQVEGQLRLVREQLVDKIRQTDIVRLDRLGSSHLYAQLTQDLDTISLRLPSLLSSLQDCVVLVLTVLYLAWLSMTALVILLIITAVMFSFYSRALPRLQKTYMTLVAQQTKLVHALEGVIDGFKSLRLSQRKTQAVQATIEDVSLQQQAEMRAVGREHAILGSVGIAYTFTAMGSLVFIAPHFDANLHTSIVEITSLLLFCLSPLGSVAASLNTIALLEARLASLHNLESALGPADGHDAACEALAETRERFRQFSRIEYRGLTFQYRSDDDEVLFTSGPIDLTLERGELVFIVGGNGSGKSTFLNLLCGLYPPDAGTVAVDGLAVTDANRPALREQFSAVFADFHLFDQLYGHDDVSPATVNQHLANLSLDKKVTYQDGAFSTTELSTGQRKRLAMAAALVDDKPIYLFDEWTADQDAEFRQRFYAEILPRLRAEGKTCVVVTHDDRYWSYADRLVKLEAGRIVSRESEPIGAP